MGRAARWLRGFLGGKKSDDGASPEESRPAKEKKRWGFVKSFREKEKGQLQRDRPAQAPPPPSQSTSEQRKGSYNDARGNYAEGSHATTRSLVDGEEQSKRAIAMAAATAAVAEAAVAAAQAAAAVVRLTSSGRSVGFVAAGGMKREVWAAVIKIQAAFRGYLARRALRALRGLVKLQALVRGNIVRKQAAETLRCMQALVRVQARARTCRALRSETSRSSKSSRSNPAPPTPEKYESAIRSSKPGYLKRNSSKQTRMDAVRKERHHSETLNWLDQWMEERYWDSREVSKAVDDEKNAKILEVDNGKPQLKSKRRTNHLQSSCSTMNSDQNSRSLAAIPDSPSKDSTTAQLSIPSPSSSVDMRQTQSHLRFPIVVEPEDPGESPHFFSATSRPGSSRRDPFTPAKSDCSRSLYSGYSDYPNYMANTESSRAKARSQSAPKQRPEYENSSSMKRLSGGQGFGLPPRAANSGERASLHAKFANKAYPGSGRLDRLGMPMKM